MSSPSSLFRAPACQESSDAARIARPGTPKYPTLLARIAIKICAGMAKVLKRLGLGNSEPSYLDDNQQAKLIERYIAPLVPSPRKLSIEEQTPAWVRDRVAGARWGSANAAFASDELSVALAPYTPSVEELEAFWMEGDDAFHCPARHNQASLKPCCVGVDKPGVGFTHAADCAVTPNGITRFGGDCERDERGAQAVTPHSYGLNQRVCLKCGGRDDSWIAEEIDGKPLVEMLGLNQLIGRTESGGYGLHTHLCEEGAR